jgi:hypothetical protein
MIKFIILVSINLVLFFSPIKHKDIFFRIDLLDLLFIQLGLILFSINAHYDSRSFIDELSIVSVSVVTCVLTYAMVAINHLSSLHVSLEPNTQLIWTVLTITFVIPMMNAYILYKKNKGYLNKSIFINIILGMISAFLFFFKL